MTNTPVTPDRSSTSSRPVRSRGTTRSVAVPATRAEVLELRNLLEANLLALQALHEQHREMLEVSLHTIDGACSELRGELRAISSANAPWVRALSESRALLFVALRELIVGSSEAELSRGFPQQEPADPHHRTR